MARDRHQGSGAGRPGDRVATRPSSRSAWRPRRRPPAPSGQAKQTDAALKKQCKTEYETIKSQVMQFLIQAEWVTQEAEKRNVEVKPASCRSRSRIRRSRPSPPRRPTRLPQDLRHDRGGHPLPRQAQRAPDKLTQDVTEDAKKVSDADVEEYYEKNQKRFAQPERRDLLIVLTKTEAKAEAGQAGARVGGSPGSRSSSSTRSTRPRRLRAASSRRSRRVSRTRRSRTPSSPPARVRSRGRSRPSSAGTCSRW